MNNRVGNQSLISPAMDGSGLGVTSSGLVRGGSSSSSHHHHSRSGAANHLHVSSSHTPNASHNQTIVTALYTYNAKDEGDLSFRKGDRLLVIDDTDPDWWLAQHMTTKVQGYIPRNYVVSEALETEE